MKDIFPDIALSAGYRMSMGAFDHTELSAIKRAADRVANILGAEKDNDKLIVTRAVFNIARYAGVFDTDELVVLSVEKLTPKLGWRFSQDDSRANEAECSD